MVQDGFFTHVDFKALFPIHGLALVLLFDQPHKVAHLAFERHIGHQPVTRLGIQTRHVACVRVAIGVAVFHIKYENKVVAVSEIHGQFPSVVEVDSSVFLVKKSCRWW